MQKTACKLILVHSRTIAAIFSDGDAASDKLPYICRETEDEHDSAWQPAPCLADSHLSRVFGQP